MKHYSSQKGFTIIETLVAITILMISIVGPLTISHKGLLAAIYAHDQVTASYLAQDAVEYVKTVRDDNIIKKRDWLTGFSGCVTSDYTQPTAYCTVDTVMGDPSTPTGITGNIAVDRSTTPPSCTDASCVLTKNYTTNIGYTHTTGANYVPTQFSRYFYIFSPSNAQGYEAKAVVIVKWTNGGVANEVDYEAELFNIQLE